MRVSERRPTRLIRAFELGLFISIATLPLFFSSTQAQSFEVSGKVLEDSIALPGVSVLVNGGGQEGTMTDSNGEFRLKLSDSNSTLVFSFVGYSPQEVNVASRSRITVQLVPDIISLSEVVVTALGLTREKKSLGYSTQEVQGSEIVKSVDGNLLNNLSGKLAGVNIIASGATGGTSRITIRGESVLGIGSNSPLFVVDGVPIDNAVRGQGIGGADFGNATAEIDPNNIESLNVLKGPAAAALYMSFNIRRMVAVVVTNIR